jgi:hypothetical protein
MSALDNGDPNTIPPLHPRAVIVSNVSEAKEVFENKPCEA